MRWLYGEAGGRVYFDSDLLVAPCDIDRAEEALARLGFTHDPFDEIPAERPWHARSWEILSERIGVDLHRTIWGAGVTPEEVWTLLSHRVERLAVAGFSLDVLDIPARFMHVALHAAQHGVTGSVLEDLERAIEKSPFEVAREAKELAVELAAVGVFAAGLRLTANGATLADQLGLPTSTDPELVLRATAADPGALTLDWFLRRPGLGSRLIFAARKLFPPLAFMAVWWPAISRRGSPIWVGYLVRPFWLARRLPRAVSSWVVARKAAKDGPRSPM